MLNSARGTKLIMGLTMKRLRLILPITAFIGTGSVFEPGNKVGLAGLTGAVMRSGGTTSLSPEKMNDELEFMASSIESSIGSDAGNVSMNSLTKNLDRTLQIFAQMLMAPAFREDKVELARRYTIESLRRQNDDPKGGADRELARAIYRGTTLGRVPTFATVKAITRADIAKVTKEDVLRVARKYLHPGAMKLVVVGDAKRFDKPLSTFGKVEEIKLEKEQ